MNLVESKALDNQKQSWLSKKIQWIGLRPARSAIKNIQSHIETWIDRQRLLMFLPRVGFYDAEIQKLGDAGIYSCHLRIAIGSHVWENWEYARSAHEAVLQTLRRLKPQEANAH